MAKYKIRKGRIAWYTQKYWKPVVVAVVGTTLMVSVIAFAGTKDESQANVQAPNESLPISEFQAFTPLESVPLDAELQEFIFGVAEDYGLEGELVMAVIGQESNYQHCALGDDGNAYGLMQVHPSQHGDRMERLKVSDLYDPYENVIVGVDYLAECIEEGGLEWGLHCYNGGAKYANALHEQGTISEYAEGVMMLAELLKGESNE